jgi:hypothetical protein
VFAAVLRRLPAIAFALLLAACDPRAQAAAAGTAPPPPSINQTHVLTFGLIGGEHAPQNTSAYEYGIAATYAQTAPWLTWAATDDRFAARIHAAGMKTTLYVDPHRLSANGFPMLHALPTDESAYYHNCDGSRVHTSYNGTLQQFVGDPASPALQAFFNGYLDTHQNATNHAYDAVWEDDAGPLSEFYQPFVQPLPGCWYPGDARYNAAQRAFDAHTHLPVIFENLANHHGSTVSQSAGLVGSPNVIAGLLEFCFANGYGGTDARAKEAGEIWSVEENTALQVIAERRMLICYNYPSGAATPQAYDQRGYILASLLLAFDPQETVMGEAVATPSGVPVEPETAFVPLQPVLPAPQTVDGLRTATGAYAREYRACYLRGTLAGPCAVVVNPSPLLPVPFPYRDGYTRTLQISGRGVIDGVDDGKVTFGGPPGLLVPPRGWVIAVR